MTVLSARRPRILLFLNQQFLIASLQTYRTFLMKWASQDIAGLIDLQHYDILGSLARVPWPSSIHLFGNANGGAK
ncbi:MAG: hypothetical protein MN733_07015 [Nitrososphaera sp.]|nr:hypothetical protein [Nitrososphaera sp.]